MAEVSSHSEDAAYHPLPQVEDISVREREDAMGAYLMMFASLGAGLPLPIINLIAAIIYYYLNKSTSRFVRFHVLQSLVSQVPVTLLNAAGVFWAVYCLYWGAFGRSFVSYIITVVLANLVYLAFSIIACVRARKGRFYYFWFFGRWTYHRVFLVRGSDASEAPVNLPPR